MLVASLFFFVYSPLYYFREARFQQSGPIEHRIPRFSWLQFVRGRRPAMVGQWFAAPSFLEMRKTVGQFVPPDRSSKKIVSSTTIETIGQFVPPDRSGKKIISDTTIETVGQFVPLTDRIGNRWSVCTTWS